MGQGNSTETVVAIVLAFERSHTWTQAALAAELGVGAGTVRRRLHQLALRGMPLTRQRQPPHVYWTVPKDWLPDAVTLGSREALQLARLLAGTPRSHRRDVLLRRVVQATMREPAPASEETTAASTDEELYLPVTEEALSQRTCLRMQYFTTGRGALGWRHVSVQRVERCPQARVAAVCHRDGTLKWFRADNIIHARLDPGEPYRPCDEQEVQRFVRESRDGVHAGGAMLDCEFFVHAPAASWVSRNLLAGMVVHPCEGGIRVHARTAGMLRVARYVVGLGSAAEVLTPELRCLVRELALGALGESDEPMHRLREEASSNVWPAGVVDSSD